MVIVMMKKIEVKAKAKQIVARWQKENKKIIKSIAELERKTGLKLADTDEDFITIKRQDGTEVTIGDPEFYSKEDNDKGVTAKDMKFTRAVFNIYKQSYEAVQKYASTIGFEYGDCEGYSSVWMLEGWSVEIENYAKDDEGIWTIRKEKVSSPKKSLHK